jgi:hypothetical protein
MNGNYSIPFLTLLNRFGSRLRLLVMSQYSPVRKDSAGPCVRE